MSEKRSNILIPNAVGRLDPVVHAIRAENWDEVQNLVVVESLRRSDKYELLLEQAREEQHQFVQLRQFYNSIFNTEFREQVLQEANQ